MKRTIVTLISIMLLSVAAFAQKPKVVISDKPGWHKIGEVNPDFKSMTETISVLGADQFKAIKMKASEGPIKIDKATINYESGTSQDTAVNANLGVGEETKTINLSRPADDIKTITFTYSIAANYHNEKAHVEIFGLK